MPVSGVDRKPERPRRERVVADQRYRRIREGPTLGGAPISIAVNFGFPLTGAGVAILYAAFFSGGALLWALGIVCVTAGVVSFASGKTL